MVQINYLIFELPPFVSTHGIFMDLKDFDEVIRPMSQMFIGGP